MGNCASGNIGTATPPQPLPLSESANNPTSKPQSVKNLPTANAKPQSVQQTANDACVAALQCHKSGSFGCFSTDRDTVEAGFLAIKDVAQVFMLNEEVLKQKVDWLKSVLKNPLSKEKKVNWITQIDPEHIIKFLQANKRVSIKIYIESLPHYTVEDEYQQIIEIDTIQNGAFCSSAQSYQLLQSVASANQSMFPITFIDGVYTHGVIELSQQAKIRYVNTTYSTSRIFFSIGEICNGGTVYGYGTHLPMQYFKTVLDAVKLLHTQYVIHGDIKPENIVLCENQAKLIDLDALYVANQIGDLLNMTYTPAFQSPIFKGLTALFKYIHKYRIDMIDISMVQHYLTDVTGNNTQRGNSFKCFNQLWSTLQRRNLSNISIIDLLSYITRATYQNIQLVKWISLKHDEYALGLTLKEVCGIEDGQNKTVDALLNLDSLWFNPKQAEQSVAASQGGKPKTTIRYMDKAYKVRLSKDNAKKYIMVKRQRVYLSDIRGKYRYVQS